MVSVILGSFHNAGVHPNVTNGEIG